MVEDSWSERHRCSSFHGPAHRRRHRMLVILPWLVFVSMATAEPSPGRGSVSGSLRATGSDEESCSEVRMALAEKVKAIADMTGSMDREDDASSSSQQLGVCSQDSVCCTVQMERLLQRQAESDLKKMVSDRMRSIKQTFVTWPAKFDGYFRGLLERSKRSLYDVINRNYAPFFENSSQIFIQLYTDLRGHYLSDEVNLEDVLDRFFTALLQRMFSLLNDDLHLTEDYLQCVAEHMDLLRAFDDVPQRLQSDIRRSFLVARAFVNSLSQGKDVVLNMAKISASDDDCSKMMARMLFCQFCQSHPSTSSSSSASSSASVRPCLDFCLSTVSQCLSQTIQLQDEWTNYLKELLRLADRLSDSLNMESVVRLLDVKISEAIVNYQHNSINVTSLVGQNCGRPSSRTRQRRSEESIESIPSSSFSSSSSSSSPSPSSSSPSSSPSSPFFSLTPSSLSPSSSDSDSSSSLSSSYSSSSPSFSDSFSSSQMLTTRSKSGQRQQQRKQQRERQQEQEEQQNEEQPEQEGQREEQGQQEEERRRHREEQPIQSRQQKEQRRQQRQRERQEEEQRRQQQEELVRQQQQYDERQRQPLLQQPLESDQYTEQPQVEEQRHRQPLLSQPRESDQYIEQPPDEQQRPRQRLQQRQPADSQQQSRRQHERGQSKPTQQPTEEQRQRRPEVILSELGQFLHEVRRKLEAVRSFWSALPLSICGDVIAVPSNETTCWNGVDRSGTDGSAVDTHHHHPIQLNSIIRQQILKLKVTSHNLRQAYNGWSENDLDGSGYGLDFGSGTEIDTAPPFLDEIRTKAAPPEVVISTQSSATVVVLRQLTSGSCQLKSSAIFLPILLSLFLIGFQRCLRFNDALYR